MKEDSPMPERRTYHKPTKIELEKRVTATADLLACGVRQGDIKRVISQRFDVSPRSVERYLRRAREILIEETGEDKELHRGKALDVYRSVLRDVGSSHSERMAAQGRIDRILGLEYQFDHAQKHEHKHAISVQVMESVRANPKARLQMLEALNDIEIPEFTLG